MRVTTSGGRPSDAFTSATFTFGTATVPCVRRRLRNGSNGRPSVVDDSGRSAAAALPASKSAIAWGVADTVGRGAEGGVAGVGVEATGTLLEGGSGVGATVRLSSQPIQTIARARLVSARFIGPPRTRGRATR